MRRTAAVALVLALLVACSGDDDADSSTSTTASTSVGMSNAGPFYLPSFLPVGLQVGEGEARAEGPGHDAHGIAIAQPAPGAGEFRGAILVLIGEAARDRSLRADEAAAARPVDVNGSQARLLESPVLGASIDWFKSGLAVAVSGPPGKADVVTDVARRVRLPATADSAAATLGSLPDGYEVMADATFVDRAPEAGQSVTIASEAGPAIAMQVIRAPNLPLVFAASGGQLLRRTEVRGKEALVSIRVEPLATGQETTTTMVWRENADVVISLATKREATLLPSIANGMAPVPEQQWRTTVPEPAQS